MTIPSDTIDRIRLSTDIVEIVKEYVPGLKRSGRNWKANCPFHNEKTPSFMVNAEKGIFHCFGCHEGGDAFKFVMKMDSISWPEAVRKLAARVGIEIIETKNDIARRSEKQAIYDLLEQTADFYHRIFKDSQEASRARQYLAGRGVNAESIEKFRIGYAPKGMLLERALKKGVTHEQLSAAGIITKTERGKYFEYMSERVVFPIFDPQGRVVAFGGRTLKDEEPKYLNSPETQVYSKSSQLYGLFQAMPSFRKRADAIVLEGYMDVLVSHQYRAVNTVATLGTALTQQQAQILKRYTDRVVLLFDSDSAGINAARKAIETVLEVELPVSVASMPEGVDPDEFLVSRGAEKFEELVRSGSVPGEEFLVSLAEKTYGLKTPDSKVKAAGELIPYIEKIRNAVLRSEWIKFISERIGITEEAFLFECNRKKSARQARQDTKDTGIRAAGTLGHRSAEEQLIQLISACPELAAGVKDDIFCDERCRKVFCFLSEGVAPCKIVESFGEEESRWLTELLLEEKTYANPGHTLDSMTSDIRRASLEIQRKKLESEVNRMISGQIPMDDLKRQKYCELNRQLKGSSGPSGVKK